MKIQLHRRFQPLMTVGFVLSIALGFLFFAEALRANVVSWGTNTFSTANAPNVVAARAIAAGYWHDLAIKSTNSVVAWGLNDYGQTNVPGGLKAIAVAAGRDHSLALTTNGTVVGWGINSNYNGDPDYFGQANPPSGLSNVVAIAAGGFHSAALKADGTVVCWGYNFYGQTNVPADLTNAIAIACGTAFSLALRNDGTIVGWGDDYYGQIDIPTDLTNVIAIAAGGFHGLALKTDGTVEGWGYDVYGQTDPPLGLTNAVTIAAGYTHSLALRSDGTVTAWGDDSYGQITGQTNRICTLSRVVAVAGGYGHNLALTNDSLFILVQPVSVITNAGVTVRLSVTAVGSGLISFNTKWWFSGTNTYVGTGSTLTLNNVNTTNIGSYFVTVSNTVNTVTSSVVTLALVDAGSPIIVTNPVGNTINAGGTATFSTIAIGAAPLGYQWWLAHTNSGQAGPITEATNIFYAVTNAQATSAGNYFAIVSNALGSATSSIAVLTVRLPPTITNDLPASISTNTGANVLFTVGVTGTAPFGYRWRFQNGISDTTLGGNQNSLTLNNVTTNHNAGNYFVIVTNMAGSVTSRVATLTISDVRVGIAPSIVTNPVSRTIIVGGSTNFTVGAVGDAPLGYQWWLTQTNTGQSTATNGPIPDATNTFYSVINAQATNAGGYFVVVTNSFGAATSRIATLTVSEAPIITNQPVDITNNAYTTVCFSVGATGTAPLAYQWRFNGTNSVIGTTNPLILCGVTSNNIGSYFVIVNNSVGSVTSRVATLNVVYNPSLTPAQLWLLSHSGISGDGLIIAMEAGKNYRVQSTTNLRDWTDITNFLSASTLMAFTNSLSTNANFMFYRVVSP